MRPRLTDEAAVAGRSSAAEMARILAGHSPTPPRLPPGRLVKLQGRSRCGLEVVLGEILEAERNTAAA